MEGVKARPGYTFTWLQRHGAAESSVIFMTPSAFMADAAWLEIAEQRTKGIRAMPVIKDHLDW